MRVPRLFNIEHSSFIIHHSSLSMGDVYFEGDPEIDSARRRMERVLKGEPPPTRWPWFLAALGSGGLWMMWRWGRDAHARNVADERRADEARRR
jgi:hypothetical protein